MQKKMLDKALKCRENSYAPYSGFKVGAAVLCDTGNIYGGCNAENAAYPCGTCAEAGAIAAMVAGGDRNIAEILVVADTACIVPCGNCLQKIAEFGTKNTLVHCANLQRIVRTYKLEELLPANFKAEDMNNAE